MRCKVYVLLVCPDEWLFCFDELDMLQSSPRHFGRKFTGVTFVNQDATKVAVFILHGNPILVDFKVRYSFFRILYPSPVSVSIKK